MTAHAIGRAVPRASPRGTARQTIGGLLVAALATALTIFVSRRSALSGVAILIVVAGTLWFATTRRTTLALAVLMIYLGALDGYVKLGTGSNIATLGRDVLLYALVIGLLVRASVQGTRLYLPPLSAWVIGYAVLVLIQLANPNNGSVVHSLGGVREDLEFVPLFFLTFVFVRTKKALRAFVLLLAALAVANGVVDFVQFHMTPQQIAAWGPGYAQRINGTGAFEFAPRVFYNAAGQVVRPFGLMGDEGAGGLVCALALGGILALAWTPGRRRYLPLAAGAAVVAVTGIITSQGRSVLVAGVVIVLAYALLTASSQRRARSVLAAAAVAAIAFGAFTIAAGTRSKVFRYHGVTTTHILSTLSAARGFSLAKIPHTLGTYPFGDGLGVVGPAAVTSGAPAGTGKVDAENEFSYLTLESGVAGMLTFVAFTVALFVLGLRRCRYEPDPEARLLLAALIAPMPAYIALYVTNPVTPTTPGGPYLWAVAGIASYWLIARPAGLRKGALERGEIT